ncbi:MAG TPA: hypothetical protein VF301_00065 [Ginsengibacter sp.]
MSRTSYCLAFYLNIKIFRNEVYEIRYLAIANMFIFIKNTVGGIVTLCLPGEIFILSCGNQKAVLYH